MVYYFSKALVSDSFDEAFWCVVEVLKQEGFGIVSDFDIKDTLKRESGVAFRNYRILGVSNPALAHDMLQIEAKVGAMSPCSVIVQDLGNGCVEVAAVDPGLSMVALDNPQLQKAAERIGEKLKRVIERL